MCILKEENPPPLKIQIPTVPLKLADQFYPLLPLGLVAQQFADNWRNLPKNSLISSFFTDLPWYPCNVASGVQTREQTGLPNPHTF